MFSKWGVVGCCEFGTSVDVRQERWPQLSWNSHLLNKYSHTSPSPKLKNTVGLPSEAIPLLRPRMISESQMGYFIRSWHNDYSNLIIN